MVTGEKKLREHLGELYGAVNSYSDRPTQSQVEETPRKLDQAGDEFQSITTAQVPALNTALPGKNLEPLNLHCGIVWRRR